MVRYPSIHIHLFLKFRKILFHLPLEMSGDYFYSNKKAPNCTLHERGTWEEALGRDKKVRIKRWVEHPPPNKLLFPPFKKNKSIVNITKYFRLLSSQCPLGHN